MLSDGGSDGGNSSFKQEINDSIHEGELSGARPGTTGGIQFSHHLMSPLSPNLSCSLIIRTGHDHRIHSHGYMLRMHGCDVHT